MPQRPKNQFEHVIAHAFRSQRNHGPHRSPLLSRTTPAILPPARRSSQRVADTEQLGGPWLESRTGTSLLHLSSVATPLELATHHRSGPKDSCSASAGLAARNPLEHQSDSRHRPFRRPEERQSQFTREETSEYSGRNSLSPLFRIVSHVCLHRWDLHGNPIAGPLLLRPSSLGRAQAGRRAAVGRWAICSIKSSLLRAAYGSLGTHPGA